MFISNRLIVSFIPKKRMMRPLVMMMAALLLSLTSLAGVEPYTNSVRGLLKKGDSLIVKDEKFRQAGFNWSAIQKQQVKNIISLQVFQDTNVVLPKVFSAEVKLKIAYYSNPDQAEPLFINNVRLKVDYKGDSLQSSKLLDTYEFENGHLVKITIEDISGDGCTIPPFLQLTSQVIIDRQYAFDPSRPVHAMYAVQEPAPTTNAFSAQVISNPAPSEILISLPNTGDNEFDIEWTTLDKGAGYDALITSLSNNQTLPEATLNELFRNNATRVTTAGGNYTVTINHYNNYLFFRVRAVQYQNGIRVEGTWDYKKDNAAYALFDITSSWHQPDLNWQYTATYAEEGKKKEVVSYLDGSLRSRQTVTINNQDKTAVVQESVYDQYGRAVAAILPAPINANALAYYKRLHLNLNGQVYSAADAIDPSGCETTPKPLAAIDPSNPTAILGAGKYYSPANGFLDKSPAYKYIPEAEGYPLAITRYTPDNTGRIKWQGGVGKAFQPAPGENSHTTKYFYGKPLQEELDKLFGNEVGYAEHYLKNMVVDANKQVSVSYLDASGKTIATALAGEAPANLESLPGKPEKKQETRKLIRPQQFQYDYTNLTLSATTTYLAEVAGSANLQFDVQKLIYKYTKSDWQVCSNCYYDLSVKVIDDCGSEVYSSTATDKIGTVNPDCNEFGTFTKEIALNFNKIGEYNISFQLALSRLVVENYTAKYIEERKQKGDWKTEYQFIEEYAKLQDFSSCFDDCATCEQELGTSEAFIANGEAQLKSRGNEITASDEIIYTSWLNSLYTTLSNQCQALKANCNYSPCDRYEKLMLEDVSPFGQYAPFKTSGTDYSVIEPLEPEINVLYQHWRTVFPVLQPGTEAYEKEVMEDDNGNPTSPHDASFTLAMLVRYWKPEWAAKFLTYHPEKCKLDFCNANAAYYNWDRQVQEEIQTAAAIASHHATQGAAYSYTNTDWLVDQDPFFKAGGKGQAYAAEIRADLQQFTVRVLKNTTAPNKDLTQFVDYMLYCISPEGNTNTGSAVDNWNNCVPNESCRIINQEWENYKDWYFQLKEKYYDLLRKNTACAGACEVGTPVSLPTAGSCSQKNEFSIIGGISESTCGTGKKQAQIVFGGINNRTLTVALQYAAPYDALGLPGTVTMEPNQTTVAICLPSDVPLSAIYVANVTCSGAIPPAASCPFGNGGTLNLPASYQHSGNTYSYSDAGTQATYTILTGKPEEQPATSAYCPTGVIEKTFYNCYTVQPVTGLPISYYNVWVIKCMVDPCAGSGAQLTSMTQVSANTFRKDDYFYYVNAPSACTSAATVYQNVPCLKVYINGVTEPLRYVNATVTRCSVCDAGSSGSIAVVQILGYNTFKDAQGGLYEIHPNTTSGQVTGSDLCASPQRNWYNCFTVNLNGVPTVYYDATVFYCAPPAPDDCEGQLTWVLNYTDGTDYYNNTIINGCFKQIDDYYLYNSNDPNNPPYHLSRCGSMGNHSWSYATCVKMAVMNGPSGPQSFIRHNVWIESCSQLKNICGGGGCLVPPAFTLAAKATSPDIDDAIKCLAYEQTLKEKQITDQLISSFSDSTLYVVRQARKDKTGLLPNVQPKKLTYFTQWRFKEHFYIQTDSATYINLHNVWVATYNPANRNVATTEKITSSSLTACPTLSDFFSESEQVEFYYEENNGFEQLNSVEDIYLKSKSGPVNRVIQINVVTETQDCANCQYNYTSSTVTLNPGEERVYIGSRIRDYAVDLQYGIYQYYYYQSPMVFNDGIICPPYTEPCTTPELQTVTPRSGTQFELAFSNVPASATSLIIQVATEPGNWTDYRVGTSSPQTVPVGEAAGTWFFRVVAYCDGQPYISNIIGYSFTTVPCSASDFTVKKSSLATCISEGQSAPMLEIQTTSGLPLCTGQSATVDIYYKDADNVVQKYSTITFAAGQQKQNICVDYSLISQSAISFYVCGSINGNCPTQPCTTPVLETVSYDGGTQFQVAFSGVSSSIQALYTETSRDQLVWQSTGITNSSPRKVMVSDASGTWCFRLRVVCNDGTTRYSNSVCYTIPSTCPQVYQHKEPRFTTIDYTLPTIDPAIEVANGIAQLQQQIKTSCEGQAEQWMASLQDGFAAKGLTEAQMATIKQRLIAVCTNGGDLDHPNGANTIRPNTTNPYSSFKEVLQNSLAAFGKGNIDMDFNPWLLESPYPWSQKPQAVAQTLTATSPALCEKLTQLQQQYAASNSGTSFYTYLVNRFGNAMTLTESQLNTLLKGCTNCKYLLEEAIPLPVFLEPGATGCITKTEWEAAQAAFAGEFEAGVLNPDHENYGDILSTYLNHRWGFTLTYDQYRGYATQLAGDPAAILCNQPVYTPVTEASYSCFNSLMATVITNGQRDYEAYVEQEKKIFRTNYVGTCLTAEPNVQLTAWQQTYHYTLYYYDQAGNLVKTVPPAGVNLLNDAQVAHVNINRKFDLTNCTYDGPDQNTDKTVALQQLSNTLDAAANRSLEFWLYNNTTGSNQVLATTPDKKYLYHSCLNGQLLAIDIYKLEAISPDRVDFTHSNHLTVDVGTLQPLHSWTHVVVQGSGLATGLLQVYVNGQLRMAVAGNPPADCSWEVTAGNPVVLPENLTTLKQLRFYDRMLNSAEIAANASQPCLGLSAAHKPALWPSLNYWARFMTPPPGGTGTVGNTTTETQVEPIYPAHTKVTTYQYNSMGQVVTQTTPDASRSNFWYDRLGRLTASQNAEQLSPERSSEVANRYSYTKYDNLGRIAEVGEKEQAVTLPAPGFITEAEKDGFLSSGTDKQVTATVYDVPATGSGVQVGLLQTNLRKRVAASLYKPLGTGPAEAASYYNYDAAGNVSTLWQQVSGTSLKKVDYQYDLVSGKMNAVLYQHGQPDAFYYQYAYDAENRLVTVYTNQIPYLTLRGLLDIRPLGSTQTDAEYRYYLHGPLMRLELGQQKVQGLDYAYTLQGWLKGINGQQLDPGTDMGRDGLQVAENPMRIMARDVLGFSLGYYTGDYTPIGGSSAHAFGLNYESQPGDITGKQIYNGNISNSTLALSVFQNGAPTGYTYGYDQLNRLKEMRQHPLTTGTSIWGRSSISELYKESYNYDPDGNILTLKRNGNKSSARLMDDLSYHYQPGTNKLDHVRDLVEAGVYSDAEVKDLEDQAPVNYRYDKIGNLIANIKEGITDIQWTVYGKIRSITKTNGTTLTYSYDPSGNRIAKAVTTGGVTTTTYYIRDAHGNVLATYEGADKQEQTLYGSSRLGVFYAHSGNRGYELTNHLGNVLATISGGKTQWDRNHDGVVDDYTVSVYTAQDYYPFGMTMPGRKYQMDIPGGPYDFLGYRYGFNGKENDGETATQDYGMRIYNPALGRFLSMDPLASNFPWNSPYGFAEGDPINYFDLDGLERPDITAQATLGTATRTTQKVVIDESIKQGAKELAEQAGKNGGTLLAETAGEHWLLRGVRFFGSKTFGLTVGAVLTDGQLASGQPSPEYMQAYNQRMQARVEGLVESMTKPKQKPTNQPETEENKKGGYFWATYTKTKVNSDGTVSTYSGRTSGWYSGTTPTAAEINAAVDRRDAGHIILNGEGYGRARLDQSSTNRAAIRGREQHLVDYNGGAQSEGGYSRNKIRGVGRNNLMRGVYDAAATVEFGRLQNNNPADKKTP